MRPRIEPMLRVVDLRSHPADAEVRTLLPRAKFDVEHAIASVQPICQAVRDEGLEALRRYGEKFDGVRYPDASPARFRVSVEAIQCATEDLAADLRDAICESIRRRRQVCEQVEAEAAWRSTELAPGAVVSQRLLPVQRVGLYVPGGVAPLASSVLMNVIPAQVAGVPSLAVASPPQAEFDGLPHPVILAVCGLLGVDEVYAVGGAQAIAMFGYGVPELCAPVDMVTGPGNIYVAAAKRLLRGQIAIDADAGPSEIAILADERADARLVAADLLSQAEHDLLAGSVLVTDSQQLLAAVQAELSVQSTKLATAERLTQALRGEQSAAVLVRDLEHGIDVINAYGAEHLEIQTREAQRVAEQITNAGAIFLGAYSPVPLGDYSAGSTHVLPTGGAARFSSGLSVRSFMRAVHVIDYSAAALAELSQKVQDFAQAEQLPAHAAAIALRQQLAEQGEHSER